MVLLHASEDRFHDPAPGSYEWSYFDGLSEDGELGFVAIWFRGCPMSPYYTAAIDGAVAAEADRYCAFNINVYHRGRRVFYALHEGPGFEFAADGADVRFGSNAVRYGAAAGGRRSYLLYLDTALALGRGGLCGEIEIGAPPFALGAITADYDATAAAHCWVPAAPDGTFSARLDVWRRGRGIRKLRFSGRAYHDRNFGAEPLHRSAVDWHWGRLHAGDATFVYFAVQPDAPIAGAVDPRAAAAPSGGARSLAPFHSMFLLEGGRLLAHDDTFALTEHPRRRHWSTLACPPALDGAGATLRFAGRTRGNLDSGPFYHRMVSDLVAEWNGRRFAGPGITEFLRPSRLGVAAFRPFVKFRVRRRAR